MRLIGLAVVLALGLILVPLAVEGQQAMKVYRIGVLGNENNPPRSTTHGKSLMVRSVHTRARRRSGGSSHTSSDLTTIRSIRSSSGT